VFAGEFMRGGRENGLSGASSQAWPRLEEKLGEQLLPIGPDTEAIGRNR